MKVSELAAALQKVQQVAGDVEVSLRHAGTDAETFLQGIGVTISPGTGDVQGGAELVHGDQAPAPPEPEPAPAPPAG